MSATFAALASAGKFVALLSWAVTALGLGKVVTAALRRVAALVVVTERLASSSGEVVAQYLNATARRVPFGDRRYVSVSRFVRPLGRVQSVFFETVEDGSNLFFVGWFPVWLFRIPSGEGSCPVCVSFIRGTVDWKGMLNEASAYEARLAEEAALRDDTGRFDIVRAYGRRGDRATPGEPPDAERVVRPTDSAVTVSSVPVGWSESELGFPPLKRALDSLVLSPVHERAVAAARFWRNDRAWHEERGVRWRLGMLLHGAPGSGKTALAIALAEAMNLPVFLLDLATLSNEEFAVHWSKAVNRRPSMVVFDDFDAVFHGRENIAPGGRLTFDALLGAIDGVENSEGVLLIVTTNRLDHIDPALGVPLVNPETGAPYDDGRTTRPGRLDLAFSFPPFDEAGRRAIAHRIIREPAHLVEEVIRLGEGEPAAQFVARCTAVARSLFAERVRTAATANAEPSA